MPENRPPKSIRLSRLFKFWPSACNRTVRFSPLVDVGAHRSIERKKRLDAPAIEVDAIHNLLAVLCERILIGAREIKWQSTAVLGSRRRPRSAS